jgi:uncharacterized protein YfaS (alpha-2-macroglobulin family)
MKKLLALSLLLLAGVASAAQISSAYEKMWKEVDEATGKGLPKTAIEKVEPIIQAALKDHAYAEAIRAICTKISLEGNIQGNKPEEKVIRLREAISNAPPEMKPVLQAIQANWYWHYFQQNRWRFMQRTQTAEAPSADFTTWDLPRILGAIDAEFQQALANDVKLKDTLISDYNALLETGSMPDACRPTLWDFLAHNAVDFYSADEQAGRKAEDAFVLQADSPIFGTVEEFLAWKIETTDDNAPTVKALHLLQDLLRFHQKDANKDALLDVDLQRLELGNRKAAGEGKNSFYKAALKRVAEANASHAFSARARAAWAQVVLDEDKDAVAARAIAAKGLADFPKSIGGNLCYNLIQQIEAKELQIANERVWNACKPELNVNYRNLEQVHFRVIAADFDARMSGKNVWQSPNWLDYNESRAMVKQPAVKEWSSPLPATTNYQQRTEHIEAPVKDLKPGFYFLFASARPDFAEDNNQIAYAAFWVSDLALVVRQTSNARGIDGFVLDAKSGEPVAGAKVGGWSQYGDKRTKLDPVITDVNGMFRMDPSGDGRNYMLVASLEGERLAMSDNLWVYRHGESTWPQSQTVFFTDRSLYRPGQTIRYKGICVSYNQPKADYQVMANTDVTVLLQDSNGKEVAKQTHRSNAYGSFDGSFTAPRDRVTGYMTLRITSGPRGSTGVSVEEYKRPKFQVTVEPPKDPAKLNAQVAVTGTAKAYTGVPLAGAKVQYRVTREVRYPMWCRWCCWDWMFPRNEGGQEIAHGTAVTADDGTFTVRFLARPAPEVDPKTEATFNYSVHADVTDSTGETRSGEHGVTVGFTALQANLRADEWLPAGKPLHLHVQTQSLDGDPRPAKGTIKIHRLRQPEKVVRAPLQNRYGWYGYRSWQTLSLKPDTDLSDPNSWELGDVAAELTFKTDDSGQGEAGCKLEAGAYRAMLTTKDAFGKEVTARLPMIVVDEAAKRLNVRVPNQLLAQQWLVQPGDTFRALWGSGYETARAFVEIEQQGKPLRAYWTAAERTQESIGVDVGESMRGGFTLRVTSVRENRAYLTSRTVQVPWSNQVLNVKWEHFVSKLGPGKKETWTAVVSGPKAEPASAEMVAALYDASLDQYKPHNWTRLFNLFRQESDFTRSIFANDLTSLQHFISNWRSDYRDATVTYRQFPQMIIYNLMGYGYFGGGVAGGRMYRMRAVGGVEMEAKNAAMAVDGVAMPMASAAPASPIVEKAAAAKGDRMLADGAADKRKAQAGDEQLRGVGGADEAGPDLSKVTARRNLNETAFFFPQLLTDAKGVVSMEFTMPEALTEWKFMAFAHDKGLRAGYLQDKAVTAKDLMVEPNPPRFVREGDTLEFTVKVSNRSDKQQKGTVRLTFSDARTLAAVDKELKNKDVDQSFKLAAGESKAFSWRITVPDGMGFLTYKAVGASGDLSDGEEGNLPVLCRRILVTESLPLPIRGKQTKEFKFDRLTSSGKSDTLRHQSLTVQMVSQPAWYAVMALPYLMEYPHECSEQTFNRLYANALAKHIANSDPKIRRIFDQWKGTPALDSPLEKNQDLKSVMLEETPWYRQAQDEKQARQNVGILFDENRLNDETKRVQAKLAEMQYGDGRWPWFPGGRPDEYITLYIVTGYGRLRHLGVKLDPAPAVKALNALDTWINDQYQEILRHGHKEENHLSSTIALYLYGRSFFLDDRSVDDKHRAAVDYFLGQAKKYWLKLDCRQSQAHLALALQRFGDKETARAIAASIRERSVSNEEMGMFWRETELSWWWYRAPIETQAMMIELFAEVANDAAAVEDCKVWLLKQKQTQDWKTTKATADAIYGLLVRGNNLLTSDALVEVALDGKWIKPEKVEAGTGFYEQRYTPDTISARMGNVTVKKTDDGVSWGSLHWQYLEDMTKVTPFDGNPLKLRKTLFVKENTKKGPELRPLKGALEVGQELVVRVELRTDRDMEYVHLKDQRGAGTEPVNVLSKYHYQDGLAYYESTRDTASHFFISYLPKGVYVFEYSTRVVHRGSYQSGIAEVQCMYAPEFNSHSESFRLEAK